MRVSVPGSLLVLSIALSSIAFAATAKSPNPSAASAPAPAAKLGQATFAGGCFWCEEATFEGLPGVVSVTSGYTGGHTVNPTYDQVTSETTGHKESVRIVFDPNKTSYAKLLQVFWHNVDPTQADGQFCDIGDSYRSAIYYMDDDQHRLAEQTKKQIEMSARLKGPIVTIIAPAGPFYPAEEYHQDFFKKNPKRYHEYRLGCGRDRRLAELWGRSASRPH